MIAFLISRNHAEVLDYGFSFFITCLDVAAKEFKIQSASIACGIGLVLSGKKQAIEDFLED